MRHLRELVTCLTLDFIDQGIYIKIIFGLPVLSLLCKEWKSLSPSLHEKTLDKLKINVFSWTHQRTEAAGQTATPKSGEMVGTSRASYLRSA